MQDVRPRRSHASQARHARGRRPSWVSSRANPRQLALNMKRRLGPHIATMTEPEPQPGISSLLLVITVGSASSLRALFNRHNRRQPKSRRRPASSIGFARHPCRASTSSCQMRQHLRVRMRVQACLHRCVLLQFVAVRIGRICSTFRLLAARCSLSTRTFNPEVAGSSPARPIRFLAICGQVRTADRALHLARVRLRGPVRRSPMQHVAVRCSSFNGIFDPIPHRLPYATHSRAPARSTRRTPRCGSGYPDSSSRLFDKRRVGLSRPCWPDRRPLRFTQRRDPALAARPSSPGRSHHVYRPHGRPLPPKPNPSLGVRIGHPCRSGAELAAG